MSIEVIFGNAQIVTVDRVFAGSVIVQDGVIADIREGGTLPRGAIDCEGDYLTPGLVELHTDNLERHMQPRPSVDWPHDAAIIAHDAELAGAGITTVFDAMRIGSINSGKTRYERYARPLASEMLALRDQGMLKISHFLHLRAEICSETLAEELAEFGPADRVGLVSLMDHTPGQRQFRDLSKLKAYVMGKNNLSEDEWLDHIAQLTDMRARFGDMHEQAAVDHARRYGALLASHDDTTADHVAKSAGYGIKLAEFPTTREAAEACHRHGIAVMMGAPNLIRGGSHSGNVSAAELAEAGLLDIISSDYVPAALLLSAYRLGQMWNDLPRAMATVTANPAKAAGLQDRGRIEQGLRGDVLRLSVAGGTPRLRGVWSRGLRVA